MTNSERLNILFFGELPPNVVHGVSISNKINTDILSEIGDLTIVEEKWDFKNHNRFVFKKVFNVLNAAKEIWKEAGRKKYKLYYSVLSVSIFGAVKQLLNITAIRLRDRKTSLLLHVHRSDLAKKITNSFIFKNYIKLLNRYETTFIVLSEMQKNECSEYLNRVQVLYNSIDENEVYPIEMVNNADKSFRFIYLSNYIKEKGIIELLLAFKEISNTENVKLDCYGSFTDKETMHIVKNISKGVPSIRVHDAIFGSDKNKALNMAHALVLPSFNEGFPLVVLECLRLGKHVIVSKVGYISKIFGEDYPLYCEPGNVESIKNSLLKVIELKNDDKFHAMHKNLYERYNFIQHREKLIQIAHESIN